MKPLNEHAWEMLRLIAENSASDGSYWVPRFENQAFQDNRGTFTVLVRGSRTTGAIRTLTARGLVEVPSGQLMHPWGRRCTAKGYDLLAVSDTEKPFRYKSKS